jgi:hypothetical protein
VEGDNRIMDDFFQRAQSKNIVIYHRGDRRGRRVFRLFQQLLRSSGASAFSVCSAVKFKDIPISQIKNRAITRPFSSQNGT